MLDPHKRSRVVRFVRSMKGEAMASTHEQARTDTPTTYTDASTQRVTAENGIEYAYRDVGDGDVPFVLLQHFRGNLATVRK
jgi:hypothetical protein